MKSKHVKKLLMDEIRKVAQSVEQYCNNPLKDFTRTRKLPIEILMLGIIGMESGSITNELIILIYHRTRLQHQHLSNKGIN